MRASLLAVALLAVAAAAEPPAAAPAPDPKVQKCVETFDAVTAYKASHPPSTQFLKQAIKLENCRAVALRTPDVCARLNALEPENAERNCRHVYDVTMYLLKARRHDPTAVAACTGMLTHMLEWFKIADSIPKVPHACSVIESDAPEADAEAAIAELLKGPQADEAAKRGFTKPARNAHNSAGVLFFPENFQCPDCNGHCCDRLAIFRASLKKDPEACGDLPICRAALGQPASVCEPLRAQAADTYCRGLNLASSEPSPADAGKK